jgi:hypothetical protein
VVELLPRNREVMSSNPARAGRVKSKDTEGSSECSFARNRRLKVKISCLSYMTLKTEVHVAAGVARLFVLSHTSNFSAI